MKKYWQFFKIQFETYLEYRADFFMSFVIKAGMVLAFVFIWTRIHADGGEIASYGLGGIILYYILTQALDGLYSSRVAKSLRDDILEGTLSNKLTKPLNPLLFFLSQHIAKVFAETLAYALLVVPIIVASPSLLGFLDLSLSNAMVFCLSCIFAMLVNFGVFFLAGAASFWTKESMGVQSIIKNSARFLIGSLIPIDLLPVVVQRFIMLTPFPYILYFPVKIAMGKVVSSEVLGALPIVFFWLVFLFFISVVVWKKGLRRYEAVGM